MVGRMTKKLTAWAKGPPPCKGVWNASDYRNPEIFRYWDGSAWWRSGLTPATAMQMFADRQIALYFGVVEWRGLASDPAKGKK